MDRGRPWTMSPDPTTSRNGEHNSSSPHSRAGYRPVYPQPPGLMTHASNTEQRLIVPGIHPVASPSAAMTPEPAFTHRLGEGVSFTFSPTKLPSKVKLRKKIDMWPLRFTLGADYDVERKEWDGVFSCKDKLLGGRLHINYQAKHVDYRKSINMGGTSVLSLRAGCTMTEEGGWRTSVGVIMEPIPIQGGAASSMPTTVQAVAARNSFDLRTKIPIAPALRAEVCGSLTLPLPAAEYQADSEGLTVSLGQGGLNLHVAEVNALIRL